MKAVPRPEPLVDIHCHLLPEIDDGAASWEESLAMAQIATQDGIATIIATPHQLGAYAHNTGDAIRERTDQLQQLLARQGVPLHVLPGADVRIEADMTSALRSGDVVTLADQGRHVLIELPHELYFPLDPVLDRLHAVGFVAILSHPERNQGLLKQPRLVEALVAQGCLMQVTAGSLVGTFGPACQRMADWMVRAGLAHFVATDGHGAKTRRPWMERAFQRVARMASLQTALDLCCRNPAAVATGADIGVAPAATPRPASRWKTA